MADEEAASRVGLQIPVCMAILLVRKRGRPVESSAKGIREPKGNPAYGTTFQAALRSLFGGEVSSLNASEVVQAAPAPQGIAQPATGIDVLISEAAKDFADYQRLTAAGKLGEAGKKLDALKDVLDRLNAHEK